MRFCVQLRITDDEARKIADDEIISLDKGDDRLEAVGLSLGEAKDLLSHLQQRVVETQAASYVAGRRRCGYCGRPFRSKGHYPMRFRTPFGAVPIASPRFHRCGCQSVNGKTFSPLTELFTEHTAPELLYLETKWASLVAYDVSVNLLKDVLPIGDTVNAETVRNHLHKMAARAEAELGEERPCFIDGCAATWKTLPYPEGPIVVGRLRAQLGGQEEPLPGGRRQIHSRGS